MCKAPKVSAPPPAPAPEPTPPPAPIQAPAPAQPAAQAADLAKPGDVKDENLNTEGGMAAKKKGRNALRIDLQAGSAGAGGTGLNVPRA